MDAFGYMSRVSVWQARLALLSVLCCAACKPAPEARERVPDAGRRAPVPAPAPDPYADFPRYGLVTGTVVVVRKSADPAAVALGWLRRGETVRLKPQGEASPTCASGWHPIHPRGYVCASDGIQISEAPPQVPEAQRGHADRNAPLPYRYYLVHDAKVAEYHFIPSREQQQKVDEYVRAWLGLIEKNDARKLAAFLAGKLPEQPLRHAAVRRFLERGYFVAGTAVIEWPERRFVQTVRGSYVREEQLTAKSGASFHGVVLDEHTQLPQVWAVRPATPLRARPLPNGKVELIEDSTAAPLARLSRVPNWKKWARVNDKLMHELSDGSLMREWYLGVAERIARPAEVGPDEPWVHIDLGEQTLVLYRGDQPLYATLVSSGVTGHETPLGSFRITRKYVSDTMSDIGADAEDDRYSIDDVPWAQYFHGARALHAAFWHTGFGLTHSHGCVNLSPPDAFYVFQHTWPPLPSAWHGVSTQKTGFKGSLVLITE
jgi:hypothetical protein